MYSASVKYLNPQRIIPNWGSGLWEQQYIYIFSFLSFCEGVCVCFCVWFCLYSFAFTICPRVLSVRFFLFFLVFLSILLVLVIIGGFVFWFGGSLLSFFLLFYYLNFFIFNNFFYFNNFLFFSFFLFSFLPSSFPLFLSFFSPFYSEPCGWQDLGALARHQSCASEVGELSSGHWSTRDLPAPSNIKQRKSPRDLHLNAKTQLHSTTSKLQSWHPMPNN